MGIPPNDAKPGPFSRGRSKSVICADFSFVIEQTRNPAQKHSFFCRRSHNRHALAWCARSCLRRCIKLPELPILPKPPGVLAKLALAPAESLSSFRKATSKCACPGFVRASKSAYPLNGLIQISAVRFRTIARAGLGNGAADSMNAWRTPPPSFLQSASSLNLRSTKPAHEELIQHDHWQNAGDSRFAQLSSRQISRPAKTKMTAM